MNLEPIATNGEHQCNNCGRVWDQGFLRTMTDVEERIDAGGVVPSGQCPECSAFCYPVQTEKNKSDIPKIVIHIEEGLIRYVFSTTPIDVVTIDTEVYDEDPTESYVILKDINGENLKVYGSIHEIEHFGIDGDDREAAEYYFNQIEKLA